MKTSRMTHLLTPSWVSTVIGAVAAIIITGGTFAISRYQGSELRQHIFDVRSSQQANGSQVQQITANLADNAWVGNLPLLLVWAAVGLVVYYFAVSIIKAFSQAARIREQSQYVNGSRNALLKEAIMRLSLRLLALVGWFVLIKITMSVLLPYALASSNVASGAELLLVVVYCFLSVFVLFVTVQLHAVFLRLIALKPRLFN